MPVIKNTEVIDGTEVSIYIEVADGPRQESIYGEEALRDGWLEKATEKVIDVADDVFGRGLELAHSCAVRVVNHINRMEADVRPDEYELQFAVQLNTGVAKIVEFGSQAQIHVAMKWLKPKHEEFP